MCTGPIKGPRGQCELLRSGLYNNFVFRVNFIKPPSKNTAQNFSGRFNSHSSHGFFGFVEAH